MKLFYALLGTETHRFTNISACFVDEFPVTRTYKIEKYKRKQSILEELSR